MSELSANRIAAEGTIFGRRCSTLILGLENAAREGGNGFTDKVENDLFELLLEQAMETMRDHASEEACILFEARAKLEFFGALAPAALRIRWRKQQWEAWQTIAHPEKVEAA